MHTRLRVKLPGSEQTFRNKLHVTAHVPCEERLSLAEAGKPKQLKRLDPVSFCELQGWSSLTTCTTQGPKACAKP